MLKIIDKIDKYVRIVVLYLFKEKFYAAKYS